MKKLSEIIRLRNIPALFLILAAVAFIGCASQKNVVTQNDSTTGNVSNLASRTPDIKTEARRIESLENHDSEDPAHYKPANNPAAKIVTKANFDRIKIGMSYREAVEIFGDEGMQTSTMKAGDRETTVFKWTVPDFSKYIDLYFENDKVIEKKQKGLM